MLQLIPGAPVTHEIDAGEAGNLTITAKCMSARQAAVYRQQIDALDAGDVQGALEVMRPWFVSLTCGAEQLDLDSLPDSVTIGWLWRIANGVFAASLLSDTMRKKSDAPLPNNGQSPAGAETAAVA